MSSTLNDARTQTLTLLTTHMTDANILKDDDATPATLLKCWEGAKYPLSLVFGGTKNVDAIFAVGTPTSKAITDYTGEIIGYSELVPIKIETINKTGITGDFLRWRCERELRYTVEKHFLEVSYRSLETLSPLDKDMGGWTLYSILCNLRYEREVDPPYSSGTTISYGHGKLYDFEDASLFDALDAGGSTATATVVEGDFLAIAIAAYVGDASITNTTNISKSSTLYPKIRWRYVCGSNTKAQIVVLFDSYNGGLTLAQNVSAGNAQIVLDKTNSTVMTSGSATITAGKIIDHISLFGCDATGIVYYDYVLLYKDDFTIPNSRYGVTQNFGASDVQLKPVGFDGSYTQALGTELASYTHECDLTKGTWKRTSESDTFLGEVFLDILASGKSELWQWYHTATEEFKVRLSDVSLPRHASPDQLDWRCRFTVTEYRASNASCSYETARSRLGLA